MWEKQKAANREDAKHAKKDKKGKVVKQPSSPGKVPSALPCAPLLRTGEGWGGGRSARRLVALAHALPKTPLRGVQCPA